MKVVIVGATKGMGRALARKLVEQGHELFLLGRNTEDLERSARDLEVRGSRPQGSFGTMLCDFAEPQHFSEALHRAQQKLGGFDTVIVTAGLFATQAALEANQELCAKLLAVNFANTVLFCEDARKRLLAQGGGTLCVFSSVAGDRARKPVVLYGASKAGLSYYLDALDHTYRAQGLRTICVRPGFVKTSMTEGLKPPPFAGEPEQVATDVMRAIQSGTPVIYTPNMWRWVMLIIRLLPRFIMRRIGF